jgi:amino acid adenylation domain-containing protein
MKDSVDESTCIHHLFETRADATPSATAFLFDRQRLTYEQLNRRANQLARHLQALGAARGTLVGVCLDRSLDIGVALLGILKAGAAYVPLDPGYPPPHLALMLEDSGAAIVLTHERLAGRLPRVEHAICIDRDDAQFDHLDAGNLPQTTTGADPAYVIYTSGTTGRPKGVVGLHRGAVNRFAWMWRAYPFASDDVCCHKTSLNFVDSLSEIFVPLLQGVATVIVPDDAAKDPRRLVDVLAAASVTRLVLVPSLLRDILALDEVGDRLRRLRLCVSSGEALSVELCRRFYERVPNAVLLNLYGSTEVSADVTVFDTRRLPADARTVPLGRPIDNTDLYIVDETLRRVPVGLAGELCVSGVGLARGYLNLPELTAERFVRNPFSTAPDARMFRTGDRVRYLPDSTIEFLGRLDQQVKIRGFRVELGDVEAAIATHPDVAQAVVVAREEDGYDVRLIAFVVPKNARTESMAYVRSFCRERLPEHMVPWAVVALPSLPLTSSGKIDRRALPATERAWPVPIGGSFVAPRTAIEAQLATIWQETLDIARVGVTDDFFDLGGHSLLAARLTAQIDKAFGRQLPVSALASAPTIEQLAALLSQPEDASPWSPLVALQPHGALRPFFLVHGIGGEVVSFTALARRLAPDQPVYGIRAKGSDGVEQALPDVESMASFYIDSVRTIAPQGPYLLGGYSSGGTVILEMARQLRAKGERVALLAMIDCEAPPEGSAHEWTARNVAAYVRNLASWIIDDDFFRSPAADKLARLRSKARLALARARTLASSEAGSADIRDVLGVWRVSDRHRAFLATHAHALATYEPRACDEPITLLRARTQRLGALLPRDLGWGRLAAGGLDIRIVSGAHDNILTEPRVALLASYLKVRLDAAHAAAAKSIGVSGGNVSDTTVT